MGILNNLILTTETRRAQINTEMITQKYINEISYKIIGCAFEVHKQLGPGLLESVYESCLIVTKLSETQLLLRW